VSEFSDSFSLAWDTSARIFGDEVTIGASTYDCVIHNLNRSTEVDGNRPGRLAVLSGEIVMKLADWTTSGGAKGTRVTVGGADGRVLNDPGVGFTSDTVTLVIGPAT